MYRRQVRRRRAVLVLLVVACLVLISTHFSEGESGPLHSAQNGIGSVLSPLEDGANQALKPFRDLVNWFDETFAARGENEDLRAEVQDLRLQLTEAEEELAAGLERGKIAKIADADPLAAYTVVDASVSARSASTWNQIMRIDKGSSDGVAVDDAVVDGDGLVGRVSAVDGGSARVILLSDQESSVTAKVLEGGPLGVVGPVVGDPKDLLLGLIQGDDEVKPGAGVITAGIDDPSLPSRYPAGIPIGEARESQVGEQELRQQVHITPYADLTNLDSVAVLTGGPS
jgi:rod shape-determining protein MreC